MSTYHFDYTYILNNLPLLLKGLVVTIQISALASAASIMWGFVLLILRLSKRKVFYMPVVAYIEIVRNVPILIHMYVVYFGLASLGITFSSFTSGVIALTLQNGGYLVEIYRGGIESLSSTQYESGLALGMRRSLILRKIILPQALKDVIIPVVNQIILLFKDSSMCAMIAVMEITNVGRLLTERSSATYEVFITIGIIFILVISIFSFASDLFERRVRILR